MAKYAVVDSNILGSALPVASCAAYIHTGDQVVEYQAVDGNYTQYYVEVKNALAGGKWPVSTDEALAVAKIIDQAREISFR